MRQLAILFLIATCVNLGFAQNVGINNVNPQAGLDVKGDVIFRVDTLELVNGVNDNIEYRRIEVHELCDYRTQYDF